MLILYESQLTMGKKSNNAKQAAMPVVSLSFEDTITYQKIHRHLRDINDTISEEDIRNVRTDIVSLGTAVAGVNEKTLITSELKDEPTSEQMAEIYEEGRKITSTWNVLSQ